MRSRREGQNSKTKDLKLKIYHLNIQRGLQQKLDKLQIELHLYSPDLVILSEHGLRKEELLSTHIPGYTLSTNFCRSHLMWGGIAMYKRDNTNLKIDEIIPEESLQPSEQTFETILLKIQLKKTNLIVIGTYRSPDPGTLKDYLEKMGNLLHQYSSKNFEIVILGDTNIDTLKTDGKSYKELKNTLNQHGCFIHKLPATRITPTSATSLDGCYHSLPPDYIKVTVYQNQISDHNSILCQIQHKTEPRRVMFKFARNYSKNNLHKLKYRLSQTDWEQVINQDLIEDKYSNFVKILRLNIDEAMPREPKKITSTKNVFWDNNTIALKDQVHQANNKFITTGSPEDKQNFIKLKKIYEQDIQRKKKSYINKKIQLADNRTRVLWRIINEERNRSGLGKMDNLRLKKTNKMIVDPYHVSNLLNSAFTQPPSETASENTSDHIHLANNKQELKEFETIPMAKLEQLLRNLKPNNSSGHDDITGKIIRHCERELKLPLLDIVNASISQAVFPQSMKISKIFPNSREVTG
ncbi:uncharacterized protein LOC120353922 [Nilaparvata lugens]|uniref:uncharacterized protein LOC120353922 n=1 Tax=Nilaparvata lugens TaxID=108931 RepID=UPI00193E7F67|nr:uncharacterized protein LOC120353922 [Nilaparvata lugens]